MANIVRQAIMSVYPLFRYFSISCNSEHIFNIWENFLETYPNLQKIAENFPEVFFRSFSVRDIEEVRFRG